MGKRILASLEDLNKLASEIGKIKCVKSVYLFGSQATGKALPMSDTDICVITQNSNKNTDGEIMSYCSDSLDVSVFHLLPVSLRLRVFIEGRPILIRNPEFINRLKLATLQEYLDFKPAINRFCMETLGCMT